MAGRRPLTAIEERQLLKVVRRLPPRDRALVTAQWLTGFRISEILSLKLGDIMRGGVLVEKIGIAPRNMKGGYGRTRWVPVLPELQRALESYLGWLRRRIILDSDLPLFDSRVSQADGSAKAIGRERARLIIKRAFASAGILDDGRLGTHSLRKTWAKHVYRNSGNDLMILKAALNHSDVAVTQAYLSVEEEDVVRAIRGCDFTRKPRSKATTTPGTSEALTIVAA
ncbi:MAG TPA: tyrosine-type recombinase/integrase [Lacunisphaera sp.]|jgi:integrase|nr:tyrosine-type recombinase/integrase [Lacunisphaera sp.]